MRGGLEVADVFRRHGAAYRDAHAGHLSLGQRRVMGAIEACRSAALGGHVEQCVGCGQVRIAYNSCRNRHCPKCQALARAEWLADRQAELLPVPYFHVVFTRAGADRRDRLPEQGCRLWHPVQGGGRDAAHHRRRSQAPGRRDRLRRRPAHLGAESASEPSLMMPGIIISCIFNEQGKLVFRAAPLQN